MVTVNSQDLLPPPSGLEVSDQKRLFGALGDLVPNVVIITTLLALGMRDYLVSLRC